MRLAAALLGSLCLAAPGFAWGEDGHVIVGKIAEAYLNPTARAKVNDLLDNRSIGDPRLSTWADQIRSSGVLNRKYKNNDRWHYINIELKAKLEEFKPDDSGDHVIGAIEKFQKVLRYGADAMGESKQPLLLVASSLGHPIVADMLKEERKEALLFIIHFVGDLHQPLHCCHRDDDRGGNLQLVKRYCGSTEPKLNLHWVWDTHILKAEKGDVSREEFATRVLGEITDEEKAVWRRGTVKDWVWDSHCVATKTVYCLADGQPLPARDQPAVELTEENYGKVNRPIVREQLKKGGVRLAQLLNDCFSETK